MTIITWDKSLSVNVGEIDEQHKKLITLINILMDAMKQGKGKEALEKIISELVAYTTTHFTLEEKYFTKFGYPDADRHKKEHQAFIAKVADFKAKIESGKLALTLEVMNFLSDWLRNHIMKTDKQYSKFFNEKGLK